MSLKKLINIGFENIGEWRLKETELLISTNNKLDAKSAMYAFVDNEEILYVGKTTNTLKKRFSGYINPGKSQNTNIGINNVLTKSLKNKRKISIYVLEDKALLKYGDFMINLAEGLEKSIIDTVLPRWNGKGLLNLKEQPEESGENVYFGEKDWEWDSFFSCHEKIRDGEPIIRTLKEYNIYPHRFIELQQKLPPNRHISNAIFDSAIFETYSSEELEVLFETIKSQNIKGETEKLGKRVEKELSRRNKIT